MALKAKLRAIGINELNGALDKFLADFPDEATRRKFLNDELDVEVWKKFASIPGDTKTWIRKSVALQERIKAKIADGTITAADVDKLKKYYSSFALPSGKIPPFPISKTIDGIEYRVEFDDFGHPQFHKSNALFDRNYIVEIFMDGSNQDFQRATSALGQKIGVENVKLINTSQIVIKLPNGTWSPPITWHHHENGKSMIPVLPDFHNDITHTGGRAIQKNGLTNFFELLF